MTFEVDTSQVATAVKSMQSALDNVTTERKNLFGAIEALDGMWVGEAHDLFVSRCTTDNETMQALCNAIQPIIDDVESAKKSYDVCEESVGDSISSIQV
ncbi:MAG: WXG100 family type VII secretion target [Clostridiales bacterium]|nr:WXG100 family type VII secretion target [Clostridiales bacterium]